MSLITLSGFYYFNISIFLNKFRLYLKLLYLNICYYKFIYSHEILKIYLI